jgi:hypothetical protein
MAGAAVLTVKRGYLVPGTVSTAAWSMTDAVLLTVRISSLKSVVAVIATVGLVTGGTVMLMQPVVEA